MDKLLLSCALQSIHFLVAQMVKKESSAMQDTWVQSLGHKNPLEKEIATQYSCLENPMYRGDRGLHFLGHKESDTTEQLTLSHSIHNQSVQSLSSVQLFVIP